MYICKIILKNIFFSLWVTTHQTCYPKGFMASPHRVSVLYARMYFSFKEIRDQNQKNSFNRGNYHISNECNINLMFTSHKFVPQFLVSFDIVSLQKLWALSRVLSSVATTTFSTCPAIDFIKLFLFGSRAWQKIWLK